MDVSDVTLRITGKNTKIHLNIWNGVYNKLCQKLYKWIFTTLTKYF